MRVGIFNYTTKDKPTIEKVLLYMGYKVKVYDYKENHYEIMKNSPIKYWVFTGSPMDALNPDSPQIDKRILSFRDNRILFICYSMESVLLQLGCQLIKRKRNNKKIFFLESIFKNYLMNDLIEPIRVFRNHESYVPVSCKRNGMRILSQYDEETMTVLYKNAVMTQWHPERTVDGSQFLLNWLNH